MKEDQLALSSIGLLFVLQVDNQLLDSNHAMGSSRIQTAWQRLMIHQPHLTLINSYLNYFLTNALEIVILSHGCYPHLRKNKHPLVTFTES